MSHHPPAEVEPPRPAPDGFAQTALPPRYPPHGLAQPYPSPLPAAASTAHARTVRWLSLVTGVAIGFALGMITGRLVGGGRAPSGGGPVNGPAIAAPELGRLDVTSRPAGAVTLVDGRVVGLTPVARLDLDPGKHSVVIDLYGYEPYLGTVTMAARGKAGLEVMLAPLGEDRESTGRWHGKGGAASRRPPRSALVTPAPPSAPAAGAGPRAPAPDAHVRTHHRVRHSEPSRPVRDCYGDESRCKSGCRDAETDCEFSCPTCSSCTTTMGDQECQRQCQACRQGCKQNRTFCESTCESQRKSCRASGS